MLAQRFEQIQLAEHVRRQRRRGLRERRGNERLRREMEHALGPNGRDNALDRERISEIALHQSEPPDTCRICVRRECALDQVERSRGREVFEIVETTSPPVRPVQRDIGMASGDELREMASREAGNPCQEDAHPN